MSLPAFAAQTVTVLRAGAITDHGATVADWNAAASHTVPGCSVQPASGGEDQVNRDAVTTGATLYAPADADIVDTDRIQYSGVTYDVAGPVRRWQTGVLDHLEVSLRAVAG